MYGVVRHPLTWYLDRLDRGVPTVSLLYGDGEFLVAGRRRTGELLQNHERISRELEDEVRASLLADGDDLVRGSDPSLLDWRTYGGRDVDQVRAVSETVAAVLTDVRPGHDFGWVDGGVWDEAVRRGELAPLIRWLKGQGSGLVVVGNRTLRSFRGWPADGPFVEVPKINAAAALDQTTAAVLGHGRRSVYVLCTGLSAIPLAMRIRSAYPGATVLDLGSTFDVFVSIGRERGWRNELYNDAAAWKALCAKNLEGVG